MHLQNYLYFNGCCDEAIAFYQSSIGAKLKMLMRFKENPDPNMPHNPATDEKVMHAELQVGETTLSRASLARRLAKEGIKVALASRTIADLEGLVKETGAKTFTCDASKPAEVARLFAGL